MKRVVVSGATGFIGRHVVSLLCSRGDEVVALTRDPERARFALREPVRLVRWVPKEESGSDAIGTADAIVNLAGEQAVGRRWTESSKKEILESRVRGTEELVQSMERSASRPAVFVSASAVGYYGDRAA